MRTSLLRAILLALWLPLAASAPAGAQQPPAAPLKLTAGLEASVTIAARQKSGSYISIALQLENKGKATVAIALVGPVPVAVDNAGSSYMMTAFSGATSCRELAVHYLPMCLLGEEISGYRDPIRLQAMTHIDPGTAVTLTFQLSGRQTTGTLVSFASVFAYRIITDPLKDETLSDAERRRQLRTLSVSFPMFPITQEK